jgi:hypothetical protein
MTWMTSLTIFVFRRPEQYAEYSVKRFQSPAKTEFEIRRPETWTVLYERQFGNRTLRKSTCGGEFRFRTNWPTATAARNRESGTRIRTALAAANPEDSQNVAAETSDIS